MMSSDTKTTSSELVCTNTAQGSSLSPGSINGPPRKATFTSLYFETDVTLSIGNYQPGASCIRVVNLEATSTECRRGSDDHHSGSPRSVTRVPWSVIIGMCI